MDRALHIPGTTNAWTMPIKARIDMLTHRGAHAGRDQDLRRRPRGDRGDRRAPGAASCARCPGRAASSPSARRAATSWTSTSKRDELARYGLSVATVQDVIMSAVGGENVTTTIEGRARFPVNVRYPRELRDDLEALGRVLVMTPAGAQIPLSQVADIRMVDRARR